MYVLSGVRRGQLPQHPQRRRSGDENSHRSAADDDLRRGEWSVVEFAAGGAVVIDHGDIMASFGCPDANGPGPLVQTRPEVN